MHHDALRTIVFSTNKCLEYLAMSYYLNEDGTFHTAPFLGTQMFILFGTIDKCSCPLLIAYLPGIHIFYITKSIISFNFDIMYIKNVYLNYFILKF